MFQHTGDSLLSCRKIAVQREEHKYIHRAHGIVDQHGASVITDQLGTKFPYQVGEIGAKANGSQLHDHVNHHHDNVV